MGWLTVTLGNKITKTKVCGSTVLYGSSHVTDQDLSCLHFLARHLHNCIIISIVCCTFAVLNLRLYIICFYAQYCSRLPEFIYRYVHCIDCFLYYKYEKHLNF